MMKSKVVLLVMVCLCLINTDIIAHGKHKGFCRDINELENVYNIKFFADSSRCEVDSIALVNTTVVDSAELEMLELEAVFIYQRDSLLDEIRNRDKEIATLKVGIATIDTCIVRIVNRVLYKKFDKDNVEDAVKIFDMIYSQEFKNGVSDIPILLRDYERSYNEFQSILKEAQSDVERTNPFTCDNYKNKYMLRINKMYYYLNFYNKKWSIRYLDKEIKKAQDILKKHSKNNYADFTSLIDLEM